MAKKFKHIPTKKLKEILDDPYTRGSNGKDYEQYKKELEHILWERQNREMLKFLKEIEDLTEEYIPPFELKDKEVPDWLIKNFNRLASEGLYGNFE